MPVTTTRDLPGELTLNSKLDRADRAHIKTQRSPERDRQLPMDRLHGITKDPQSMNPILMKNMMITYWGMRLERVISQPR
jgi:hypothetical protein